MNTNDITKLKLEVDKGFPPFYHKLEIQEDIESKLSKNDGKWETVNVYLDSLGVNGTTDKYGLIINMYQNYLNDVDINITEEINIMTSYWSPIHSCDAIQNQQATHNFQNIEINDTISVQLPIDEHENAVDYFCPDIDWTYQNNHDLEIEVIIKEKINTNNQNYFNAEIVFMSNEYATIRASEFSTGDMIKIPLKTAWKLIPKS